jgi:hypothetical protein
MRTFSRQTSRACVSHSSPNVASVSGRWHAAGSRQQESRALFEMKRASMQDVVGVVVRKIACPTRIFPHLRAHSSCATVSNK